MPLRDHFRKPKILGGHWESFHSAWVNTIAQRLNERHLPKQYLALPTTKPGTVVEVDVATIVWAPPEPTRAAQIDLTTHDVFGVQVFESDAEMRLVAAIELVSPANKDRPRHRQYFAAKYAAYLQQRVAVVIVDIVTERTANLYRELVQMLEWAEAAADTTWDLYAVALRAIGTTAESRLDEWVAPLTIGEPLPTLPLWIAPDLAIPLELELTYTSTRTRLRLEP
jgi:hypothetical protein